MSTAELPPYRQTVRQWWNDPVDHYWVLDFLRPRGYLTPLRVLVGMGGILMGVALVVMLYAALREPVAVSRAIVVVLAVAAFSWPFYWWFFPWPAARTSVTLFILTDIGIALASLTHADPLAALATTPLFAVTGLYIVFFHGPRAGLAHLCIAAVTVLGTAIWLGTSDQQDAVVLAICKGIISLMVTAGILPFAQFVIWLIRNSQVESLIDPLTGLANRRGLHDQVARLTAAGPARPMCVFVVDLDKFKAINDGHGHAAGDRVLVRTAHLLRDAVSRTGFVARTGGEEFVLVDYLPTRDARRLGEGLLDGIAAADPPVVTASAGLVCGQPHSIADFDRLLDRADRAMYAAKHDGGNRLTVVEQ